jgi:hypothetical protein
MICKTEGGTPRALKMRKLEALKVGGVQREGKKKKTHFVSNKAYFSSCYFFITPFQFALHK